MWRSPPGKAGEGRWRPETVGEMRGSEQHGNPGWSPWIPPSEPSYYNGLGSQKHSPFEDGMNYILFPTHHSSPQDQVLLNPVLPWHSCHWHYFHSPGHTRSSILPEWMNWWMNSLTPDHTIQLICNRNTVIQIGHSEMSSKSSVSISSLLGTLWT